MLCFSMKRREAVMTSIDLYDKSSNALLINDRDKSPFQFAGLGVYRRVFDPPRRNPFHQNLRPRLGLVWAIVLSLRCLSRHLEALLCAATGAALVVSFAFADVSPDKRVALVIGNGAYQHAPKLDNATFDARAIADAFRKLGFQVVDGYDLDVEQMRAKISEFSEELPEARSAVIYYAGHGISVDDENYLIPTDIVLKSPTDLDFSAISVSLILKQMKREDHVNIVVLDACRDNPFAASLARNKTRAIVGERGLSRIDGDLARGTLIAFASDPKSTALDGPPGQHSPFTEAFLNHVFDPDVPIDLVMSRVRTEVWEKTHHGQLPWVNTSLIGDYALNPHPEADPARDTAAGAATAAALPATGPTDRQTQENLLWESAQHSNLRADYQAYLNAFPSGIFAQMAKNRIAIVESPATAPSETNWKSEIATADTEKALDLTPADQKEVQLRLSALDLYKGLATGALDSPTRLALSEWQKQRGVASTSFLGRMQLAALRSESEDAYRKLLAAQSTSKPTSRQAVRRATRATDAKAPAKEPMKILEPTRRVTKRAARPPAPDAVAPLDPGGTPAWRQKAGLPVKGSEPTTVPSFEFLGGSTRQW
jgi:uncharacterized caspase-like protein